MKENTSKISKNAQEHDQILGINVSSSSMISLLAGVEGLIPDSTELGGHKTKFYILTPNPEIILMAQTDKKLKNALNSADFTIPDGIGLKFAIPGLKIIKGREFFSELIRLANGHDWRVFLLGGLENEAEIASRKLQITYPKLQIQSFKGPNLDKNCEPETEVDKKLQKDAIDKINKYKPQLLFVAFGNPNQEIWVHDNFSKLNICGAMAVGGVFRYVAGVSPLPPKWMADIGLEWLWRLITEPHRLKRILNAVVVFPLKVVYSKIFS